MFETVAHPIKTLAQIILWSFWENIQKVTSFALDLLKKNNNGVFAKTFGVDMFSRRIVSSLDRGAC